MKRTPNHSLCLLLCRAQKIDFFCIIWHIRIPSLVNPLCSPNENLANDTCLRSECNRVAKAWAIDSTCTGRLESIIRSYTAVSSKNITILCPVANYHRWLSWMIQSVRGSLSDWKWRYRTAGSALSIDASTAMLVLRNSYGVFKK